MRAVDEFLSFIGAVSIRRHRRTRSNGRRHHAVENCVSFARHIASFHNPICPIAGGGLQALRNRLVERLHRVLRSECSPSILLLIR